jgi:hypothetical protein
VSRLSPKPIIAQVHRTWHLPVGMSFSLVEDLERRVWIVQSCPIGTHVWTVEQAAILPRGAQTRRALREAVTLGRELERQNVATSLPREEVGSRTGGAHARREASLCA